MDHLADSIAELFQGRKNRYTGREGVQINASLGEGCELAIVFESLELFVCTRGLKTRSSYEGR